MRLPFLTRALLLVAGWRKDRVVYLLDEGGAETRKAALRGGKGAGLAELAALGMPVPYAATITTNVGQSYACNRTIPRQLATQLSAALGRIEKESGLRFGSRHRPLLVSVRSGARVSMPGMMDTVLNVGLNDITVQGLARRAGDRFAWDSYRRFLAMFGATVMGVDKNLFERRISLAKIEEGVVNDCDLSVNRLIRLCQNYKRIIEVACARTIPTDPMEQLTMAIFAVLTSWHSERCVAYRSSENIPFEWGTAVTIQAMVFGNTGDNSGTGVIFSRNPATGKQGLYGEYLTNAQGEDVVAGVRTPSNISELTEQMPLVHAQLTTLVQRLENHFDDMMDIEFTVEDGKLFLLQCRSAKRTALASVTYAVDQVRNGIWSIDRALSSLKHGDIARLTSRGFDPEALESARLDKTRFIYCGNSASPGAATGKVAFTCSKAKEIAARGEPVILMRHDTSPDDLPGMLVAKAIVTAVGGSTSHAAVVARGKCIPAVVGCRFDMEPNGRSARCEHFTVQEEQVISVDGTSGLVVTGELAMTSVVQTEEVVTFLEWVETRAQDNAPRPIDITLMEERFSLNDWLNDFYLSNLMAAKACDSSFEHQADILKNTIEARLAAIFTCYLAYAVTSELEHYTGSTTCPTPKPVPAWQRLKSKHSVSMDMITSSRLDVVNGLAGMPLADQAEYFAMCEEVFSDPAWSRAFGGPKWAVIARTGKEYLSGVLPRSVFIDHVFDLRHNGNCMFNKHYMVNLKTSEDNLVRQLNEKKTSTGVSSLMDKLQKYGAFAEAVRTLYEAGLKADLWGASSETSQAEVDPEYFSSESFTTGSLQAQADPAPRIYRAAAVLGALPGYGLAETFPDHVLQDAEMLWLGNSHSPQKLQQ
jgi:pyruvate,orthophosphate dikinase